MSSIGPLETVRTEDFIEYFLFPDRNSYADKAEDLILTEYITKINEITEKYCSGYIWHKDPFHVSVRYGNSNLLIENQSTVDDDLPFHCYGITHFDDNIQDEWFIVSLLFELTRQMPGLVARCCDADGEFLLIEAAEYLPQWATPDTCSGRLLIYNGALYLLDHTKAKSIVTMTDALIELRTNLASNKVSDDISNCVQNRIASYPQSIRENHHQTIVYIPVSAAALLQHNPALVAAAVRAFCQRDPIDLKACRAMKYFPPENRVYTNITFTKCLYAMLMHNNFQPDRRIGWNLPSTTDPTYKSHLLGVKLACGFEILAAQAKPSPDAQSTKAWHKYNESLKSRGYFEDYLENSKDFNRLLEAAKEYFMLHIFPMSCAEEIGTKMLDNLKELEYNVEQFKEKESMLLPDDDDSWMNISPEQLDSMLQSRYGLKKTFNGNLNAAEFGENISDFLQKQSDYTGIETADDEVKPIPPKRGIKKAKNLTKHIEPSESSSGTDSPLAVGNTIDFNPDAFQTHVQEMLDLIIPEDNWESNSDMSDFGDEDGLGQNIENMERAAPKEKIKTSITKYMDQMDRELARTTIGKSFEKTTLKTKMKRDDDNFDDIEDYTPVDIDVNALKNIADSYQHQLGGPGPASTLLNSMGVRMKAGGCVDDLNVKNS